MGMVRQLEFSLFDFRLHAEFTDEAPTNPLDMHRKVREDIAVVQSPEFNRFPNGFSHIFAGGYAAGYYSYKWRSEERRVGKECRTRWSSKHYNKTVYVR